MLAQMDDEGIERAVYYFSKRMLAYEVRRRFLASDEAAVQAGSIVVDFPVLSSFFFV